MPMTNALGLNGPRRWLHLAGALAAAMLGLSGLHSASAQTPVHFTLDWRFEGPSALFLMAQEKGYFKEEGLDVTIDAGASSRETIPRVASGNYDAGFGDVNALIRYRDEHPTVDMKAVMMIYDKPAFAIVGRKSRGIGNDVKTLEGKKLGAPAMDASFAHWPIFRTVNKIDDSKIKLENIGFPVREPMLAAGEVDGVFGFAMSAAVSLRARGVPAEDIVSLLMADYGVELYGSAVMVSPKFLAEKPEAVRGLLRAIVKGIKDAAADPELGAKLVVQRNEIARLDVEMERLKLVIEQNVLTPWVKANGLGGVDPTRWGRALDQLTIAAPFRDREKAAAAFSDSYLPKLADRKF